ncbi:MAG: hypothetical protein KC621_12085 [Myxococcales bacterium]|nr:hypothetical protein [Myxococcales bacterium]
MWSILLMACASTEPAPEPCVPATEADILERRGEYYVCLDARLGGCGEDGYPLGYGAFYAERYLLEVRPLVSEAGQAFLDAVSVCLQQDMAAFATDASTCDEVWDHGFSSHPDCYVASGFCEVDLESQLAIADAVEPEDTELPEQQEQVLEVAIRCLEARP